MADRYTTKGKAVSKKKRKKEKMKGGADGGWFFYMTLDPWGSGVVVVVG